MLDNVLKANFFLKAYVIDIKAQKLKLPQFDLRKFSILLYFIQYFFQFFAEFPFYIPLFHIFCFTNDSKHNFGGIYLILHKEHQAFR